MPALHGQLLQGHFKRDASRWTCCEGEGEERIEFWQPSLSGSPVSSANSLIFCEMPFPHSRSDQVVCIRPQTASLWLPTHSGKGEDGSLRAIAEMPGKRNRHTFLLAWTRCVRCCSHCTWLTPKSQAKRKQIWETEKKRKLRILPCGLRPEPSHAHSQNSLKLCIAWTSDAMIGSCCFWTPSWVVFSVIDKRTLLLTVRKPGI